MILCVKEFKNKINLKRHKEKGNHCSTVEKSLRLTGDQEYICQFQIGFDKIKNEPILCHRKFTKRWEYNIHIKKLNLFAHGKTLKIGGNLTCKYCNLTFEDSKTLKNHEVTHNEERMQEIQKYREENFKCEFLIDIDAVNG